MLLINSSRGSVVDNKSILHPAILDVWEGEPEINTELLKKVYIGTPHIAGYSYDGKVNGAVMIFNKACDYFKIDRELTVPDVIPGVMESVIYTKYYDSYENTIHNIIKKVYDINKDHENLLKTLELNTSEERSKYFDKLRKEYPIRREFYNYTVSLDKKKPFYDRLSQDIQTLGFKIISIND